MDKQDRIWQLFARKMAREASADELQELNDLIKDDPSMDMQLQLMTEFWNNSSPIGNPQNDEAFNRILEQAGEEEVLPDIKPSESRKVVSPLRGKISLPIFNRSMLRNYGTVAWRNLTRNKSFSVINIAGLALGMVSALAILIWVFKEMSVDQFHSKKDRLYQVLSRATFDGEKQVWWSTPKPLGPVLQEDYPQVETVARLNWVLLFVLHAGSQQYQERGVFADPGFLKMFDFPMLKGNPDSALSSDYSIVLTESMAKKLFGHTNVLGHTVRIDSSDYFTVTGVLKDLPKNTDFSFTYMVPWSYLKRVGWNDSLWQNNNIMTMVLLKPGITETDANQLFANIVKKHVPDSENELFVHPLKKWHLYSRFEDGKVAGGNIEYIRMFTVIAIFILLIACINYVNMSTARSQKRAREVGIRKVVGAQRGSLVTQFLGESILVSLLAGAIALILLYPTLIMFNKLINDQLTVPFGDYRFWLAAVGFIIATGVLAGVYPAFYLSSYQPVKVLKGHFKKIRVFVTPRKMLVTLQFSFALTMIICTIVIYRQIKHTQERDPGYNGKGLAYMYMKGKMEQNYFDIRKELLASGAVSDITRSNCPITDVWSSGDDYRWPDLQKGKRYAIQRFSTDLHYISAMGLHLESGRDLDVEKYPGDTSAVLLNETAAKLMHISPGQKIKQGERELTVAGVIHNFIPFMPHQAFMPAVVHGDTKNFGAISFRLNTTNDKEDNLSTIARIFKKYNPDYPFEYFFANETYASKFNGEKTLATLAALFAGLTIFISCLGLFALAACLAENRIKEIGVRKVMGASVARIMALLSKDFFQPIIWAIIIATPVAWWCMDQWLSGYSYHITISWWMVALAALLVFLIAIATVSYQTIKAAVANPVKSLRTE